VPLSDFLPYFSGIVLRADMSVLDLTKNTPGKKAHWFWGEMLQFRRRIARGNCAGVVCSEQQLAISVVQLTSL
jgi:ATP-binding cassette subfamily C protein LapB